MIPKVNLSFLPSQKIAMTSTVTTTTRTTNGTFSHSKEDTDTDTVKIAVNTLWVEFLRNKLSSSSRIGFHIFRPKVNNIIILGERHSGTTFFTKYLHDCFPNVSVKDTFINYKHWFQPDPNYLLRVVTTEFESLIGIADDERELSSWRDIVKNGITNNRDQKSAHFSKYFENSLVIVLFRNPYDWVEAMRQKPWHWPEHISLFPLPAQNSSIKIQNIGSEGYSSQKSFVGHKLLNWKEFVNRPLYLKGYYEEQDDNNHRIYCQKGYPPNSTSPCGQNRRFIPNEVKGIPEVFLRHLQFELNDPIYEKNQNGEPFENILQLRSIKLKNLLSIPEQWELAGIGFVQYDSLLGNRLKSLVEQIGRVIGINENVCPITPLFKKKTYNISAEFRDWITKSAQWDVEKLIGYQPVL